MKTEIVKIPGTRPAKYFLAIEVTQLDALVVRLAKTMHANDEDIYSPGRGDWMPEDMRHHLPPWQKLPPERKAWWRNMARVALIAAGCDKRLFNPQPRKSHE